jgi:hypothetical protein
VKAERKRGLDKQRMETEIVKRKLEIYTENGKRKL